MKYEERVNKFQMKKFLCFSQKLIRLNNLFYFVIITEIIKSLNLRLLNQQLLFQYPK